MKKVNFTAREKQEQERMHEMKEFFILGVFLTTTETDAHLISSKLQALKPLFIHLINFFS